MPRAYPSTGQIDKSGPFKNGYEISNIATFPTLHEIITAFFERLKPKKTWALIAETLDLKEHTAKHRAANHTSYSAEEIRLLLQGENGEEVLDLLMADAMPTWWRDLRKTIELTRIRGEQALLQQRALALDNTPMARQDRRKMKKVIDADRTLSATRADQETAAGVLLQNRNSAVAGAVAETNRKIKAAGADRTAAGRGR